MIKIPNFHIKYIGTLPQGRVTPSDKFKLATSRGHDILFAFKNNICKLRTVTYHFQRYKSNRFNGPAASRVYFNH